jgi:hypothetical protein
MKWLLATFIVVSNALTTRFCVHCKHFIPNGVSPEFGKCRAFPIRDTVDDYFVTGKSTVKEEYRYCSTARNYENLCGNSGKRFVKLDTLDRLY